MKVRRPVAVAGVVCALVGCTLTRSDVRTDALLPAGLGRSGQVLAPKQCALKLMIPARPLNDPALNEALWNVADAQAVDDEVRRALEANGLRVGVITGELPSEVRAVLEAPPPNRVDPAIVILPDGDNSVVDLGAARAELNLLLSRSGAVAGKPYRDARGHIRVTAHQDGEDGVALRLAPELHHGPIRQGWGTAPGGGMFAPQQLVPRTGQAEETFRELTATLRLRPGQVAVVGTVPERTGSLGHFLLTAAEANSDRLMQKVLLIWASRSEGSADPLPAGLQPFEPDLAAAKAPEAVASPRGEEP